MLKKKNIFAGYLVLTVLLSTLVLAQTKVAKDPRVLKGYNQNLKNQKVVKAVNPKASARLNYVSPFRFHKATKAEYAKGEAVVVLKKTASFAVASSSMSSQGMKVVKNFKMLSSKGRGSYMLVSSSDTTENLIAKLRKDPNVQSVSPNYIRRISATPNDAAYDQMWGLHNIGQSINGVSGTDDADIDAPEAWDTQSGTKDVVVAVFDTGVEYNHEDLSANMWVNAGEIAGNGVDDDSNGFIDDVYGYDFAGGSSGENDSDPLDIDAHGTHVSGTIGAKGDNGIGIVGVNWDVSIMAIKIFRPDLGGYDSDILEAIDYVLMMKASGVNIVAINASYGGGGGSQSDPMNAAIQSLGDAGIIFVAAAGNDGTDNDATPNYPSSYSASNIIAVAATDSDNNLASFSQYGATSVDLGAPGVAILSSVPGAGVTVTIDNSIFFDDMESGAGNWETTGTNDSWTLTSEDAYSGSSSWTDSEGENYLNDTYSSLVYGSDIDLSSYVGQDIGVGACMKYDLETNFDYVFIEVSIDAGANWITLETISGLQTSWACGGVFIPDLFKTANFRMRVRLFTDFIINQDGIHIDDIGIGFITGVSAPNSYAYFDGTSMATPHVVGSVALMAAEHPSESTNTRIARILNATVPLASLSGKVLTGGLLNIENALTSVVVPRPSSLQVSQTEGVFAEDIIFIEGSSFGESQGKVYFSNGESSSVEVNASFWSDTNVTVTVPENAGKLVSLETSEGGTSNQVKLSSWAQVMPTNEGRTGSASVAYNGKMYTFGGVDFSTFTSINTAEVYDPSNNTWSNIAAMSTGRDLLSVATINDKIYAIGGLNEDTGEVYDTVEVYTPESNSWDTVASLPTGSFLAAAISVDNTLYVMGGLDDTFSPLDTLYAYNESNDTWTQKASLNTARAEHAVASFAGKIYVFGGRDSSSTLSSVEVYDPASNTWSYVSPMPKAISWLSATADVDNIVLAGGVDENFVALDDVLFYDPVEDMWTNQIGGITDIITAKFATSLVYLENAGFFSVGGYDGSNGLSEVEVLNIDNISIAVNDASTVVEDGTVSVPVLDNDDGNGESLSITSVSAASNGTADINGTVINYTPNANFNGNDSFIYTVSDESNNTDTATVFITVNAVNDDPVAVDDTASVTEDVPISISVLTNDNDDADGDTLSISSLTTASNGTASINGTSIDYTPNANFGGSDSFTYTISDGNGGTATANVSVTVNAVNDDPIAADDTASVAEDGSVNILVLSNDNDDADGDILSIDSVSVASNGTASINGANIDYTPNANFNGSDSFTYTISDGNTGTATANVVVTVNAVNDEPIAVDDNVSITIEDASSIDIQVLDNDVDVDADTLSITALLTDPSNGTADINGTAITYTPDANYSGTDSFSYEMNDGNGESSSATVNIIVNNAPVAQEDNATAGEDGNITIDVLGNDDDENNDTLSILSVSNPAHGTAKIVSASAVSSQKLANTILVSPAATSGDTIVYTPDSNYNGTDSFTYTVSDGNGGTDTVTVNLVVSAVADAPIAGNDTATVTENGSVTISVLSNDSDADGDTISIVEVSTPAHGTAVIEGTNIIYTPDSGYHGTDSFTYSITDGSSITTATVNLSVIEEDTSDSGSSGGGGCTYNPNNKNFDMTLVLMMMLALLYPLRRRYLR